MSNLLFSLIRRENDTSPEDEESILADFDSEDLNGDDVGNETDGRKESAASSGGPKVRMNPAPLAM